MTGYMCKYVPRELVAAYGGTPVLLNGEVSDFATSEHLIHQNVCGRAKAFLINALSEDEIILTDCCDSMRRVGDIICDADRRAAGHNTKPDTGTPPRADAFLYNIDVPHDTGDMRTDFFKEEILKFAKAYGEHTGREFDRAAFLATWEAGAPKLPEGPFVAVMGAGIGDALMETIRETLTMPVVNLTCTGERFMEMPPTDAKNMDFEELMGAYAASLLGQMPCMRMKDIGTRGKLEKLPGLSGIIYNTVKFCDYYSFEYMNVALKSDRPVLKIETDYTRQTAGQLATRLMAFEETLEKKEKRMRHDAKGGLYLGIDIGSTTAEAVAVDADGNILAMARRRTGARAVAAAQKVFDDICEKLGVNRDAFLHITATGYGREGVSFATDTKTEITCHARGAFAQDPKTRAIIDIGGQDSKIICLNEDGNVSGFVMNDKCAAGTGRFLEMMARTLELELPVMASMGATWREDLTISSTCTVFAESEVVSLIAQNKATDDIIHGLNKSIAAKTASMAKRAGAKGPFMMTGGVARNPGVVREIERRLSEKMSIPKNPDHCGALGAALFAAGL